MYNIGVLSHPLYKQFIVLTHQFHDPNRTPLSDRACILTRYCHIQTVPNNSEMQNHASPKNGPPQIGAVHRYLCHGARINFVEGFG
jgi:hypothetical protein